MWGARGLRARLWYRARGVQILPRDPGKGCARWPGVTGKRLNARRFALVRELRKPFPFIPESP